jgi:hemerythrin-like metal-binding protein
MRALVLEWTPLLGVGIVSLNQDHKGLFGAYNDLIETLERNREKRSFLGAFEQFLECAERHFAHEELVMRNINYGGYLSHKAAHDRLRVDARDFILNVESAYTHSDLPIVARYFRYWLIHHIVVEDAKIAAFVDRGWGLPAPELSTSEDDWLGYQQTVHHLCCPRAISIKNEDLAAGA